MTQVQKLAGLAVLILLAIAGSFAVDWKFLRRRALL